MSADRHTATATPANNRYPDGEDWTHPSEVSDPSVREDETKPSLRTRIRSNLLLIIGGGLLAAVLVFSIARFLPGIISNKWVQLGVLLITVAAVSLTTGRRQSVHRSSNIHEGVLYKGDGVERFYGTVEPGNQDGYAVLKPYKGFSYFGGLGDRYTVGELAPQLVQMQQGPSVTADDDATIRLDSEYSALQSSEFGTLIVQHTSGLELDDSHAETALVAGEPELADIDALADLQTQIDMVRNERDSLQDNLQSERRNRREAELRARKRREEIIDEHTDSFQQIMEPLQRSTVTTTQRSTSTPRSNEPSADQYRQEARNDD